MSVRRPVRMLDGLESSSLSPIGIGQPAGLTGAPPPIPDHELLRLIGLGSYGEVWLARNALGSLRAVKVVHRQSFDHDKPYEREFNGLKNFEPISHARESQVDIFHVGRNDEAGFFYYIMELADDANAECGARSAESTLTRPSDTLSHPMGEGLGEGLLVSN
ncbi:MAG: hypothetical protein HY674_11930 [Chloroflexi bacterium]|nr:hypothetical protein [Chloroflexota bacterium]